MHFSSALPAGWSRVERRKMKKVGGLARRNENTVREVKKRTNLEHKHDTEKNKEDLQQQKQQHRATS
jgi:hypothetical protein